MADNFAENGGKILTFEADGNYYAFDILSVTDIIEIPEITPVPKTPGYLLGVMNLRGKVVPVMDFRKRLGLPDTEYTRKSCIIVVEINSMQIGVLVDCVYDVENILPEQIAVSPVINSTVAYFITTEDKRISLLNPEMFVRGRTV